MFKIVEKTNYANFLSRHSLLVSTIIMFLLFGADLFLGSGVKLAPLYMFVLFFSFNTPQKHIIFLVSLAILFSLVDLLIPEVPVVPFLRYVQRVITIIGVSFVGYLINKIARGNDLLRERLHTLQNVFEAIQDAIIVVDKSGTIVRTNKAVSFLGYTSDELIGKNVDILVPDRFHESHEAMRLLYVDNPRVRTFGLDANLSALHKTQGEMPVQIALSPLFLDNNEPFTIATIADATTHHAILTKLQQSNSELEQFAYIASHDLQEPLRAITNHIQLIEKNYISLFDEKARQSLQFVVNGASRMKVLITDLLEYSRLSTRGGPFSSVDLNTLLETVLSDMSISISEHTVIVKVLHHLPTVFIDQIQIHQVFQNILSNAIRYRKDTVGLIITITVRKEGNEWIFCITDNGIGIANESFNNIFMIFNTVDIESTVKGNGMGLATCKKIIERHGGRIWVESTLDIGSAFYFSLPISYSNNDSQKT